MIMVYKVYAKVNRKMQNSPARIASQSDAGGECRIKNFPAEGGIPLNQKNSNIQKCISVFFPVFPPLSCFLPSFLRRQESYILMRNNYETAQSQSAVT